MAPLRLLVLRWAIKLREVSESLWEQAWFGFLFVVIYAIACGYWLFEIPAPGYAVAVMGVAAALMAARTKASGYEKAAWMLVMFGLLYVETRAIRKDRCDNEDKQEQVHKEQKQNFIDIGDGIRAQIKESQEHFDATMSRIDMTLKTSEATLRNTQPIASLEFKSMSVYAPSLPIAVGHQLEFNVEFTNAGNDTTRSYDRDARLYVRRLDDPEAQREIADDFNKWWDVSQHPASTSLRPNYPGFFSFKSFPLTESEVSGVLNHNLTIYALIRFTWTDRTGRWASDECFAFQDPTHDLTTGHPCISFTRHRYKAKQH